MSAAPASPSLPCPFLLVHCGAAWRAKLLSHRPRRQAQAWAQKTMLKHACSLLWKSTCAAAMSGGHNRAPHGARQKTAVPVCALSAGTTQNTHLPPHRKRQHVCMSPTYSHTSRLPDTVLESGNYTYLVTHQVTPPAAPPGSCTGQSVGPEAHRLPLLPCSAATRLVSCQALEGRTPRSALIKTCVHKGYKDEAGSRTCPLARS